MPDISLSEPLPTPRFCVVILLGSGYLRLDETMASLLLQAGRFRLRVHVMAGPSPDASMRRLRQWEKRLKNSLFPMQCEGIELSFAAGPETAQLADGFGIIGVKADDILTGLEAGDTLLPGALRFVAARMTQFAAVDWLAGRPCRADAAGMMCELGEAPSASAGTGVFWRGRVWLEAGRAETAVMYGADVPLAVHSGQREEAAALANVLRYDESTDAWRVETTEPPLPLLTPMYVSTSGKPMAKIAASFGKGFGGLQAPRPEWQLPRGYRRQKEAVSHFSFQAPAATVYTVQLTFRTSEAGLSAAVHCRGRQLWAAELPLTGNVRNGEGSWEVLLEKGTNRLELSTEGPENALMVLSIDALPVSCVY